MYVCFIMLGYNRHTPACAFLFYNPISMKSPSFTGAAVSFSSLIMSSVMPSFNSFLCGGVVMLGYK